MRPTVMKINMDTLMGNARLLREAVGRDTKMLCVVKADAYGHGAVPFAKRLEAEGLADAFAVAIVEEAAALRGAGIRSMIVILGGACEESLREAVRADASQAVYTAEALRVLQDEAVKLGRDAKAHLKVDSGMSRIGVRTEEELRALLDAWKECPNVRMEGCFTHFCVADTDPAFTKAQDDVFSRMLEIIHEAGYTPIAHAAASTAMLNKAYHHDMVRAGIALYGSCMPGIDVRNAQTLSTRPIRIETIPAGGTVGYGRTWTARRDTRVMTIPIGYGDGYPRILSNRADVLVHGMRAPIVGRVCMDMLMADITDIPDVELTDEVVLMGTQGNETISPDELAEKAETIPYEIMLGFLPRIPMEITEE